MVLTRLVCLSDFLFFVFEAGICILRQVFTRYLAGRYAVKLKEVINCREVSVDCGRPRFEFLLEMSFVFAKDMCPLAFVLDEHSKVFTRGAQEAQEVIYS